MKKVLSTPTKRDSRRVLSLADRWGHAKPRPKTWTSGIISIVVYIVLAVCGTYLAIQYQNLPLEPTTDVLWSAYGGPFPLKLTCAAESCWASMSLRGAYEPCVHKVPASQLDTCISLRRGESFTLATCYALLPSEGIRLYHVGADAEQWAAIAPETGLGKASDAPFFGLLSVSDMPMPGGVMPTNTPLRAGVTQMTYVRTRNRTFSEGEEGAERHEWFSQILDSNPPREQEDDPCAAEISAPAGDVHVAVLRMAPDYTEIVIEHPPSFLLGVFGRGRRSAWALRRDLQSVCPDLAQGSFHVRAPPQNRARLRDCCAVRQGRGERTDERRGQERAG